MNTLRRITAAGALGLLAATLLSGCHGSSEAAGDDAAPVTLAKVEGADLYTVTLTANAVDRLGITTGTVAAPAAGLHSPGTRPVTATVPYAAVVYDSDGSTWTYTETGQDSFVRRAIDVEAIVGSTAYLTSAPPVGTPVVVVGAPELLGAEYEIAGEE